MSDGYLIKSIQTLSRATKVEFLAASLLQIVHQKLKLSKTILILSKQCYAQQAAAEIASTTCFLTTIAQRQKFKAEQPAITFYLKSTIVAHQINAPISLFNYYLHQQNFSIISHNTKANFEDIYLSQQQPTSFSCFPIVNRGQFFGILYLEELELDSSCKLDGLASTTEEFITALTNQTAIACSNFLEQEKQQHLLLNRQHQAVEQINFDLQQKLQQFQQKSIAVEVAIDGIAILKNERFVYLNLSHITMFGYDSPAELIDQTWQILYPPEEITKIQQQTFPVFMQQGYWRGEFKAQKRDGTLFDQEIALFKLDDEQMVCICRDISDRKAKEKKLHQSQKYLTKQLKKEQLLSKLTQEIRHSWDILAISQTAANQIGKVFQVHRCLIHGYITKSELQIPVVAQYTGDGEINPVNTTIPITDNHHLQQALSKDSAVVSTDVFAESLSPEIEQLYQRFDIKSILSVRTSYQGKPNGIITLHQCKTIREWTIDEIELLEAVALQMGIAIAQARLLETEQQQRQELYLNNLALAKAKQDAEVASNAKSQFLAHMSHELRTPLNAILGFGQIMQRDTSLDSSQQEYITIINRSGQHLLNLINNILDLSKIEAGKITINEDYLDFYNFLTEIEQLFRLQAQAKGLKLTIQSNSELPQFIITDEVKLQQILINLLDNALKFTNQGEVSLQIRVQNSQSLIFEVSDTGAGIAQAELDRIFEPFEQTNIGIKSGQGTGLGLSICRSLVKLLGGFLEVKSIVNQGTTFLLQIPLKIVDSQTFEKSAIASKTFQQQILVIDGEIDHCILLKKLLVQVGFNVKKAHNLQEASEIYRTWLPDLILLNTKTSAIDADQTIQEFKNYDTSNQTRIIILTENPQQREKTQILENDLATIISKPFDSTELLKIIARELNLNHYYNHDCLSSDSSTENYFHLETLSSMSTEWLEALHYAAISASERKIYALIEQIPREYSTLASNLTEMVNNFALEGIINQVENLLEISD